MINKKSVVLTLLLLVITGVFLSEESTAQSFQVWSERTGIFTIGKPSQINIYVKNTGVTIDSYSITITRKEAYYLTSPVHHLLSVEIPSNRIEFIGSNDVGDTFATLKILGPITNGLVEFNVTSDSDGWSTTSIQITGAGTMISFPEFKLIGLIQILILASLILIVSNPSHFS